MVQFTDNVKAFYDACTEMTRAKLILADAKISKILKSIVSAPELVDIVGESLVGFNFENEFTRAQSKSERESARFILPNESGKIIGLVFSLLSQFDTHRMDLPTFIFQYFSGDDESLVDSYDRFVDKIILPFRDCLSIAAGMELQMEEDEDMLHTELEDADLEARGMVGVIEKAKELGRDEPDTDTFFEDMTVILNQIKETINMDYRLKSDRRDELNITIDALISSLQLKNLKIMNALMISLNYLLRPVKSVRFYNMELQNRLLEFYDSLR